MSDRPAPSDRILYLLGEKAVYQIVRLLADGPASMRTITTRIAPNVGRLLRLLAVEGFVRRNGSWDIAPTPDSIFDLTERGEDLVGQLDRLEEWARRRNHPNAT